jgi:2-polyprenyl-6-methoxyphenol hydroxylase-like FAD-dependent oxidoreductase
VEFLEDTEAAGLLTDRARKAVAGVAVWRRSAAEGSNLFADFVVEASGRGSRAAVWLEALGYDKPAESVVNARLGYASRIFRRPAGFDPGWRGMFQQAAPPEHPYAGVVFPIEGGRLMVTLAGGGGHYPPVDDDGFLAFACKLRNPAIAELIRQAEPVSAIAGFRGTENRWRHYEKLRRRPERFVVLGDAACAFNPVYGQGITTAALGAVTLQRCLGAMPSGRAAGRFQQELAGELLGPWTFATGEDVRYRNLGGASLSPQARFMHWYVDRVLELSTHDEAARRAVLEVFHLLKQPDSLFQPRIAGSILRGLLLGAPLPQAAGQTA